MSKLTEQDYEVIGHIVERKLRHYKLISEDAPIAPVEETQYVECVDNDNWFNSITKGNIYKVNSVSGDTYEILDNTGNNHDYFKTRFKPSTLSAFTAQNTIAQTELKQGEWAWNNENKRFIGTVTYVKGGIILDNQKGDKWTTQPQYLVKPTPEEIEQHLTTIAISKGYKTGTKIISIVDWHEPKECIIDASSLIKGFSLSSKGVFCLNGYAIWNGKWASILEVEPIKEERWLPAYGEIFYYVSVGWNVQKGSIFNIKNPTDESMFRNGNVFKTEEEAQIAADKIKQLLTTL